MFFYLGIALLLMVLSFLVRRNPRASRQIYRVVGFFVFLLVALRYQVGCDWGAYLLHFQLIAPNESAGQVRLVEPAYWFLLFAIYDLGLPFETLNVVVAIIFFTGLSYFARSQPNPMAILAVAFPILIFAIPMSALRQAAAAGFIFPALVFFIRRQLVPYVILIFLGFLFHTSAILFLLLAPFIKFRMSVRNMLFLSPFVLLIGYLIVGLEGVEAATARYVDNVQNDAAGAPFRTLLLALFGVYFFAFLSKRWRFKSPLDHNLMKIGAAMMIASFVLVFFIPTVADRFGYYLIIFQGLIVGRVHFIGDRNADAVMIGSYSIILVFFTAWWTLSYLLPFCYDPYQTFLF